jgi:hypothetical protein
MSTANIINYLNILNLLRLISTLLRKENRIIKTSKMQKYNSFKARINILEK